MKQRNFELARFIRIKADPEQLSRDELIDELYDLANYASLKIGECITLRGIIDRSINNSK
jgi:hypothetical protein